MPHRESLDEEEQRLEKGLLRQNGQHPRRKGRKVSALKCHRKGLLKLSRVTLTTSELLTTGLTRSTGLGQPVKWPRSTGLGQPVKWSKKPNQSNRPGQLLGPVQRDTNECGSFSADQHVASSGVFQERDGEYLHCQAVGARKRVLGVLHTRTQVPLRPDPDPRCLRLWLIPTPSRSSFR